MSFNKSKQKLKKSLKKVDNMLFETLQKGRKDIFKQQLKSHPQAQDEEGNQDNEGLSDELHSLQKNLLKIRKNTIISNINNQNTPEDYIKKYEFSHDKDVRNEAQKILQNKRLGKSNKTDHSVTPKKNWKNNRTEQPTSKHIRRLRSLIAKDPLQKALPGEPGKRAKDIPNKVKYAGSAVGDIKHAHGFGIIEDATLNPDTSFNAKTQKHNINGEDLFHHYISNGKENLHILTPEHSLFDITYRGPHSEPRINANKVRAIISTTNYEDKNHLRWEWGKHEIGVDQLKNIMKANPENNYEPHIALDSQKNSEPGWEGHNDHLFHGLVPDKSLIKLPETVSSWISAAGVRGDSTPRVITKEAAEHGDDGLKHKSSSFHDEKFTSAHREATYDKLANDVFGLGQYVPKTTVFRHPLSNKPWSAQEFVPGLQEPNNSNKDLEKLHQNGDLYKISLMNMILGNNDRHRGNYAFDAAGNLKLIDNGFSFDFMNDHGEFLPNYISTDDNSLRFEGSVPESVHKWLYSIDPVQLSKQLKDSGAPQHLVDMTLKRLYDAKAWSSIVGHGDNRYKKDDVDDSFMHLLNLLRVRNFSNNDKEIKQKQDLIHKTILKGNPKPNIPVNENSVKNITQMPKDGADDSHSKNFAGRSSKKGL